MLIGFDSSGKFEIAGDYAPSVMAAAVMPPDASREIAEWTAAALEKWGRSDLGEIHMQQLDWGPRLEVCGMLAGRDDVRLAAVLTDQHLLGSPERVTRHRQDQLAKIRAQDPPTTEEGVRRLDEVTKLLEGSGLSDSDYLLSAVVPKLVTLAAQQAFCFFRDAGWRDDMTVFRLIADEETPTAARYVTTSLLPVLGGDGRFGFVTPLEWREPPEHPMLRRARHADGYLRPQALFEPIQWESSHDHTALQIADAAAWVVRRAVMRPEAISLECFGLLEPLLVGDGGMIFDIFALRDVPPELDVIYAPRRWGTQPLWWLSG